MSYLRKAKEQQDDLDFIELSFYNNAVSEKMMKDAFPRPKSVVPMKGKPSAEAILEYESNLSKPFTTPDGRVYNLKIGFNPPDLQIATDEDIDRDLELLSPDDIDYLNRENVEFARQSSDLEKGVMFIREYLTGNSIIPDDRQEEDIIRQIGFPFSTLAEEIAEAKQRKIDAGQNYTVGDTRLITYKYIKLEQELQQKLNERRDRVAKNAQAIDDNPRKMDEKNQIRGTQAKVNAEKIKEFEDTLNTSSRGLFNPKQQVGEDASEYLQRMKDELANASEAPEDLLDEQASMMISRKFKEKLKEVIKSIAEIEQIMASIPDVAEREDIIKNWADVKPRLLKLNMVNNNKFKPSEYKEFFDAYMTRDRYGLSNVENALKQVGQSLSSDIGEIKLAVLGSKKNIGSEIVGDYTYTYQFELDQDDPAKRAKIFIVEITNNTTASHPSYIFIKIASLPVKSSNKLQQKIFMSDTLPPDDGEWSVISMKKLSSSYPEIATQISKPEIYDELSKYSRVYPKDYPFKMSEQGAKAGGKASIITGVGIKKAEIPKMAEFGEIFILPHKLYTENILTLKNKHNRFINGFKDMLVSDSFVELIMKMLKGDENDYKLFNKLSNDEKNVLMDVFYLAKLHKTHGEGIVGDTENKRTELKKQFKILEGELNAGNDNPKIINDLYHLVHKMRMYNMISTAELNKYIKQLK